jgi:hypothetical protein
MCQLDFVIHDSDGSSRWPSQKLLAVQSERSQLLPASKSTKKSLDAENKSNHISYSAGRCLLSSREDMLRLPRRLFEPEPRRLQPHWVEASNMVAAPEAGGRNIICACLQF